MEAASSVAITLSDIMILKMEQNSTKHPELIDLYELINSGPEIGI